MHKFNNFETYCAFNNRSIKYYTSRLAQDAVNYSFVFSN